MHAILLHIMTKGQSKQKRRNRSESPPASRHVSNATNRDNDNGGSDTSQPTPLRLTPPIIPSHQKHIRSLSGSPKFIATQSTPTTPTTVDVTKSIRGNHRRSVSFDACTTLPPMHGNIISPPLPTSTVVVDSVCGSGENQEIVMDVPNSNTDAHENTNSTIQPNGDVTVANVPTPTTYPPSSPRTVRLKNVQRTENDTVKHNDNDNNAEHVPLIVNETPNASELEIREYVKFLRHLSLESSHASIKIQRKMYKLRIMHNIKIISDVICSFILVIFGALIQRATNPVSVDVTQSTQNTSAMMQKSATTTTSTTSGEDVFGSTQRRMVYASIALNGFIACTTALMGQLGIMQKIQVGTESLLLLQQQLDRLVMADTNFDCNCKMSDIRQSKMSLLVSHAKWKDKVMQFDVSIVQPLSNAPPATTRYFGSGPVGLVNLSSSSPGRPDLQPRLSDLLQAQPSHGRSFYDHMTWASTTNSPSSNTGSTSLAMAPLPSQNIYHRRVQPSRVPVVSQ